MNFVGMQRIDASLPVTAETLEGMVGASAQVQRFSMTVMMLFAAVALVLGAVGIYGVLANVVLQQTRNFGIRMALGAPTANVVWIVLRRALALLGIGLALGTAGAVAATRMLAGLLFEVGPTDMWSFVGAVAAVAVVSLLASAVPAWRASRVDPIVALRAD